MSADSAVLYLDSGPGLARRSTGGLCTEGIECYTTGLLPEQPGRLAGRLFSRADNGAGCCQLTLTGSPAGSLLECPCWSGQWPGRWGRPSRSVAASVAPAGSLPTEPSAGLGNAGGIMMRGARGVASGPGAAVVPRSGRPAPRPGRAPSCPGPFAPPRQARAGPASSS